MSEADDAVTIDYGPVYPVAREERAVGTVGIFENPLSVVRAYDGVPPGHA
jgi:hypothetical protein